MIFNKNNNIKKQSYVQNSDEDNDDDENTQPLFRHDNYNSHKTYDKKTGVNFHNYKDFLK